MTTNWKFTGCIASITCLSVLMTGCFESEYSKQVKSELARGIRNDSLILGIRFGDTSDDFFGRCFDLNKQHLVTQGPGGNSVQYLFTDSLFHKEPHQIQMLFSPRFDAQKKISEMQIELSYMEWAPWNRAFQSDSLKQKTLRILEHWYGGNQFITANIRGTEVPVKVDGNRRILVNIKDPRSIKVRIQDLLHPEFAHSISKDDGSETN